MGYFFFAITSNICQCFIFPKPVNASFSISLIIFAILIYLCSMSGYTTKRKNPDDYMEINKKQREKDIAQVKAQEKYDNDWGYIR